MRLSEGEGDLGRVAARARERDGPERIDDAVEALQRFEAEAGTGIREASWGGLRAATMAVISAAEAWVAVSGQDDPLSDTKVDAVLDQLGEAVSTFREAQL